MKSMSQENAEVIASDLDPSSEGFMIQEKPVGGPRGSWVIGLLLLGVAGTGFYLGSRYETGVVADKAPYRELEKFSKVLQFVEANYVEPVKGDDLVEGAIKGMLGTMDPHSAYLPPELYKEMKVETSGKFGGLGIEVTIKDGTIIVVAPIDDSPAYRAGVKTGDQIVKIAGKSAKQIGLQEAVQLMRGKPGSKIAVTLLRKGAPKLIDLVLTRESIKLQSVKYARLPNNTGYFRISSFMERTGDELAKAFTKLNTEHKLEGLVLDLRGNPGGLLDQAVKVVNVFVDEGPVVYTIGRDKKKKEIEFAQKGRQLTDLPLVVLVDGSSASASEIVAGALQDYGRGIIAGQQTFGKGSVQTIIPLADDSGLKLTIARYYTPSGRSIQVKGITPDVWLDYIDPKVIDEARKNSKSLREADLAGHFENEQGDGDDNDNGDSLAPASDKDATPALSKSDDSKVVLPLEERLKKDYMVSQAEGILRTLAVFKKGFKKPEFKLDEDSAVAQAPSETKSSRNEHSR
jgi:carboxyl-terminal processing protease